MPKQNEIGAVVLRIWINRVLKTYFSYYGKTGSWTRTTERLGFLRFCSIMAKNWDFQYERLSNGRKACESKQKAALMATLQNLARAAGLEPATYGLTVRCSTD